MYIYIMGTSCVQLNGHLGVYIIFRRAPTKTIQNPFILHIIYIYTVYILYNYTNTMYIYILLIIDPIVSLLTILCIPQEMYACRYRI
jgi:hypothetical protein